jgi:hypothetical protein
VLTELRPRLVDTGRVDTPLDLMLDRLKAAGLVTAGGRQRTDATHVIAAVRRLNRVETVGRPPRAALEAIARVSPDRVVPPLKPGWDERYGREVATARLLGSPPRHLRAGPGRPDRRRRSQAADRLAADRNAAWMTTVVGATKMLRVNRNQLIT